MACEIACADLGDKVPALAGMSFVQWGEDVPPPLSPATGIDGPWLARLGLAAPAPPRRFTLPPSLAGVRTSVVWGQRLYVRLQHGGRRLPTKNKDKQTPQQ